MWAILVAEGLPHQVRYCPVVSSPEAFAIGLSHIRRHVVWMPVLISIVHIRLPVVLKVVARAIDAVVESTLLNFIELRRIRVPLRWRRRRSRLKSRTPFSHQVRHSPVVSAPESLAIGTPRVRWKMRTPVFVAILDVWLPVIFNIAAGAFDAIVETLPLNFIEFLRRRIPAIARRRTFLSGESSRHRRCGQSQEQSNRSNCESICLHVLSPLALVRWSVVGNRLMEQAFWPVSSMSIV